MSQLTILPGDSHCKKSATGGATSLLSAHRDDFVLPRRRFASLDRLALLSGLNYSLRSYSLQQAELFYTAKLFDLADDRNISDLLGIAREIQFSVADCF